MNDLNIAILMSLWMVGFLSSIYVGIKFKRELLWTSYLCFSVALVLICMISRTLIIGTDQLRQMQINPNDLDPVANLIFGPGFLFIVILFVFFGLQKSEN